jgi:hypothetical protein
MRQYIISYDLYRPSHNYSDLTKAIKQLGEDWDHPLSNLWIVETKLSAEQIRSRLIDHLVAGDKLYIRAVGKDFAGMDIAPGAPFDMTATSSTARAPVKLTDNVLAKDEPTPRETRLLTAATVESW